MPSIVQASASLSTVTASPGTIANDGVESCVVTLTVRDAAGDVVPGVAAAACVLAVSGTGNTVTQPTGVTDSGGRISGSFVSTGAATKAASFTLAGLAITQTQDVVVTGSAIPYPNEPSGFTRFAESDYSILPGASGMVDGAGYTLVDPASNITLETSPTRLKYHHIAGTVPGFAPPNYAQFGMWDLASELSNTEYSEVYVYHEITLVGNGGTYETPAGPGFKFLGYIGCTNNNQNPATGAGPVQIYTIASPTNADSSSPLQASEFHFDCYTQNGISRALPQNLNLDTHLVVGTKHTLEMYLCLNDVGSANGIWRWWIDGVQVGEYTDIEFINAAFAQYDSTGLSGFFGTKMDLVWGGSGGANKTRDDTTDWHKSYFSGVFLRAAGA